MKTTEATCPQCGNDTAETWTNWLLSKIQNMLREQTGNLDQRIMIL